MSRKTRRQFRSDVRSPTLMRLSWTATGMRFRWVCRGSCIWEAMAWLAAISMTTKCQRIVLSSTPSADDAGAKLYKTGDIVRQLKDGNIEFVGRHDHQVKMRGYRIELGEIETALSQHPSVSDIVVLCRQDIPGVNRLCAYVVPMDGAAACDADFNAFLRDRLPDYMIPSAYVELASMPLNVNGKIDRKALPPPEQSSEEPFLAPRNERERVLADIWAEVLGADRVGVFDNFFELGGDSILSIQIVSKAGEAGLELTPKQLFENPTIAELAEVAEINVGQPAAQGEVTGSAPLTPIQCWFFDQEFDHPEHFNHAVLLEVPSSLDASVIDKALQCLFEHHDALRLRFTKSAGIWRQEYALSCGEPVLTRFDLSDLDDSARASTIEARSAEIQTTLNLSGGPLVRAALFEVGQAETNRLLIIIHHLVVDIVSWRILLDHLHLAVTQLSNGASVTLPAKTSSYRGYSENLTAYAGSSTLLSQADTWLADAQTNTSPLPTDHAAGDGRNTYGSIATYSCALSADETESLLQDVSKAYNTQVNDVVLTAVVQAFRLWTGSQVLRLDMEGHGRSEVIGGADVSRTVGWFTAMYPVVLEAKDTDDPAALIKFTKERLRQVPSGGIGYGLMRYLGNDEKVKSDLCASPYAEVSYNYIGHLDQVVPGSSFFCMAQESFGPLNHPTQTRPHLLSVHAMIAEGCFRTDWLYSEKVHKRDTIECVANQFVAALRELITHCLSEQAGGYTPSDFSLAGLDQEALDRLKLKYETNEDNT